MGSLTPSWQEYKLMQCFWRAIWLYVSKFKMHTNLFDPEIPLLRIYPSEKPQKFTEVYIEGWHFVV